VKEMSVEVGGLYSEGASMADAGTTMSGASMFSSMLGYVGLAYSLYNVISSGYAAAKQNREQARLAREQTKQAELLRQKIKADNAGLYSAAMSSTALRSGAMGAVY
jgi:CHASE1-domain containing sensor protein